MEILFLLLLAIHTSHQDSNIGGITQLYDDIANEVLKLNPGSILKTWQNTTRSLSAAVSDNNLNANLAKLQETIEKLEKAVPRRAQFSENEFDFNYNYATTILILFERLWGSEYPVKDKQLRSAGCAMHKLYRKWNSLCPKLTTQDRMALLSLGSYYPGYYLSRNDPINAVAFPCCTVVSGVSSSWERFWFKPEVQKTDEFFDGDIVGLDNEGKLLTNSNFGWLWDRWELGKWEKLQLRLKSDVEGISTKLPLRFCASVYLQSVVDNQIFMVVRERQPSTPSVAGGSWVVIKPDGIIAKLQ